MTWREPAATTVPVRDTSCICDISFRVHYEHCQACPCFGEPSLPETIASMAALRDAAAGALVELERLGT